jgi:hypothetical protein
LAGTVLEAEAVCATEDGVWSGRASLTYRHRAKVDANSIRQLGVGEAVFVSRGRAARLLVLPLLPSPQILGTPHGVNHLAPLDRLRRQVVDPARGPRLGEMGQLGRGVCRREVMRSNSPTGSGQPELRQFIGNWEIRSPSARLQPV